MPTPSVLSFVFSRFPNKHVRAFFLLFKIANPRLTLSVQASCPTHDEHRATIGFNETIRNWHEERYFTSFSRGIGIQFSTSNNTTSLNDHWLVYRHCAKLKFQTFLKIYTWPFFNNLLWVQIGFNSSIYWLKLDGKLITV